MMVLDYEKSRVEVCAGRVYQAHAESNGLDGVSRDRYERGMEAVVEFVTDYAVSAVLAGLGVEADSAEGKRIIGAYVEGVQRLDPAEFASAMNRGKPRKVR